ncbi:uncharacterized protein LOC103512501 [Diaphorina citri]|uniref:Uncharacterized protein LOC103512501 n=1 Tax=Diaphorina citri TaxID=121845 RepID=A0A3Q0IZV6_DIACI|nr:uncharacterized protein LOC103512501 [Diaphorina citri]
MSKMKNMHGFKIKCLTKNKPPDSVLYMADNDWVSSGLGVNLLREIYQKMNFTPDIIFPQPDSPHNVDRFGYDISPNMNSLIIGALTIREVDLAFGVFSHLLYQSPTTEFSTSAAEECFTFAVPANAGRPPSIWSDFINEFRPMVWFLLGVTFVVNVFVWYLATKWQLSKDSRILSSHLGEDRRRILVSTTQSNGDTGNWCGNVVRTSGTRMLNALVTDATVPLKVYNMHRKNCVSNAQTLLACRSRNPRITSKDSSEDSKITLEQVIFFEIALTLGIPMLNKVGNRWLMRFLVIQYVFFCLITSQAYLGSLGSFMTYPDEKGQINTPEELYDRNLKLTGVLQSKRILERAFSKQEILKKLSKRYKFYSGYYDDLMLDIHHGRNTSTFATSRFLQFYINNNHILKNNPDSIYLFPKCTVTSYSSPFLFQKGSPFIDPINKILHRIIESGITKKWYESSTPRKMVSKRDPVHRLDLSQILGVFVILLMLLGISMVVFLLELVTHSYYKRNENNNL